MGVRWSCFNGIMRSSVEVETSSIAFNLLRSFPCTLLSKASRWYYVDGIYKCLNEVAPRWELQPRTSHNMKRWEEVSDLVQHNELRHVLYNTCTTCHHMKMKDSDLDLITCQHGGLQRACGSPASAGSSACGCSQSGRCSETGNQQARDQHQAIGCLTASLVYLPFNLK